MVTGDCTPLSLASGRAASNRCCYHRGAFVQGVTSQNLTLIAAASFSLITLRPDRFSFLIATMLDLPELDDKVCWYLSRHDLAQCARVSKQWNSIVIPHLWHSLTWIQTEFHYWTEKSYRRGSFVPWQIKVSRMFNGWLPTGPDYVPSMESEMRMKYVNGYKRAPISTMW